METALHPGLRAATSVAALECRAELRLPYATGGYGVNKIYFACAVLNAVQCLTLRCCQRRPVAHRSAEVHRAGLLMGLAGIRTTHNPAIMLAHDKHGYPDDFVTSYEPNSKLNALKIPLNPDVTEADFQQMLAKAKLSPAERQNLSLTTFQSEVYRSYWSLDERSVQDAWLPMMKLSSRHLRKLMHPLASSTQGLHESEAAV